MTLRGYLWYNQIVIDKWEAVRSDYLVLANAAMAWVALPTSCSYGITIIEE